VEVGSGAVGVVWDRPADLAVAWLPIRLEFAVESEGPDYDLDERMFELWESFRRRKGALLAALRRELRRAYGLRRWSNAKALVYAKGVPRFG
jgi:hypothetical protein